MACTCRCTGQAGCPRHRYQAHPWLRMLATLGAGAFVLGFVASLPGSGIPSWVAGVTSMLGALVVIGLLIWVQRRL